MSGSSGSSVPDPPLIQEPWPIVPLGSPVLQSSLRALPPSSPDSDARFTLPPWFLVSLVINGILLTWVVLLSNVPRSQTLGNPDSPAQTRSPGLASAPRSSAAAAFRESQTDPLALNPRHQLTYDRWVTLLAQEAQAAAEQAPPNLYVLAGDSISLWFPSTWLPQGMAWLNQGISGETAGGLYQRLNLFDGVNAQAIFVMIGINDLIKGTAPQQVAQEQQEIVQYLKAQHPQSKIVVQSILPHGSTGSTWEGRDRLLRLPNGEIRALNQTLKEMTVTEGVYYLDLWPLFSDDQGRLRLELSTDGLHLNDEGYLVWSTAIQLFRQIELSDPDVNS
ncbi:GDSL-type esterase/lipase family protein [Prochlorothrix hollandica]|uniref:GDSL-type esterase/lipase family protein n=1 Tax=Prochlorothrix hollandica TaxID=1223 RepID=UPI0009DAD5F0|nr:GDSL-type esterase/lipase family protein [Prochlorothrix hollandica]